MTGKTTEIAREGNEGFSPHKTKTNISTRLISLTLALSLEVQDAMI